AQTQTNDIDTYTQATDSDSQNPYLQFAQDPFPTESEIRHLMDTDTPTDPIGTQPSKANPACTYDLDKLLEEYEEMKAHKAPYFHNNKGQCPYCSDSDCTMSPC